ncbi:MAG: hypothetical protein ACK5GN_05730 [Pseudomonadota bacterium]|jgi:hypothetical protein
MRALGFIIACCLMTSACGGVKDYQPIPKNEGLFMPSVRTVGPEPVYARTRWVRAPQVLPERDNPVASEGALRDSPSLRPVFQLSLKNTTLEETARVLAATARYSSYTAPSIAKEKISVTNLGTIDELARIIESKARVQVVVDHENREVRFLAAHAEQPRLFDE